MAKSLPSIATIATIAHVTARREYARRFGIDPDDYVLGVCAREDWKRYERDLERLGGRVWVLLSHWLPDEKAFFLEQLDRRGTRLDARQFGHAAVYLYELGPR